MADTPIRPAATVMLVRDGAAGVEVFVQSRVRGMAFAGGMTAFPGGGIDPTDAAPIGWVGPAPQWWADRFGCNGNDGVELARQVVVAAVREVVEEAGVLLAVGVPGGLACGQARRDDLVQHRIGLAELLDGGSIRADLLRPWARWITPPGQSRRYDTFFLLAAVPDGQQALLLTTEADAAEWIAPAAALEQARLGQRSMMPPTVAMLTELAEASSTAALLPAEPAIVAIAPEIVSAPGEPIRVRAGDREFGITS